MTKSSRARAKTWPYPRHIHYERNLRQAAANWFSENKYPVRQKMPYILASFEDWPKNIILPEVADYIVHERERREQLRKGFPLHKYIHHGLSSQAMVFNLIGPLIVQNDLAVLKPIFEEKSLDWPKGKVNGKFEYEDRSIFNEDSGQPTSIDLVLKDEKDKPHFFIEAKLVEREFGGCSVFAAGDCDGRNPAQDFSLCYLHHIGRRYWELLEEHGFLTGQLGKEHICILSVYYQFFREVLFALENGGSFILLYDIRNPTFYKDDAKGNRGLLPFLSSFIPVSQKHRVGKITIQEVVSAIKESKRHPWISKFEHKYGMVN